jgi:hypothetical protein
MALWMTRTKQAVVDLLGGSVFQIHDVYQPEKPHPKPLPVGILVRYLLAPPVPGGFADSRLGAPRLKHDDSFLTERPSRAAAGHAILEQEVHPVAHGRTCV